MEEDEDVPKLSSDTLAALQEFYKEIELAKSIVSTVNETESSLFQNDMDKLFSEDWQMSQFWYDDETCQKLSKEIFTASRTYPEDERKIACLSCPSVFHAFKKAYFDDEKVQIQLFEYDKRFAAYGSSFTFYDYNEPDNIPDEFKKNFSVIIADPPFLSPECMEKISKTIKIISKDNVKILFCTGAVMEDEIKRNLGLQKTSFEPKHRNNLQNEFTCFSNYDINL